MAELGSCCGRRQEEPEPQATSPNACPPALSHEPHPGAPGRGTRESLHRSSRTMSQNTAYVKHRNTRFCTKM